MPAAGAVVAAYAAVFSRRGCCVVTLSSPMATSAGVPLITGWGPEPSTVTSTVSLSAAGTSRGLLRLFALGIVAFFALVTFLQLRLGRCDNAIVVLGVLEVIFRHHRIARTQSIAGHCAVFIGNMLGRTPDFSRQDRCCHRCAIAGCRFSCCCLLLLLRPRPRLFCWS